MSGSPRSFPSSAPTERSHHRRAGAASLGGFPDAPYPQGLARSQQAARALRAWRLEWPAGSKFVYHPTSGFWVGGGDHRAPQRPRLPRFRARADRRAARASRSAHRPAARAELARRRSGLRRRAAPREENKKLGFPDIPPSEVNEEHHHTASTVPNVREAGVPGGGGIMTGGDLALFYRGFRDGRSTTASGSGTRDACGALRVRSGDYAIPYSASGATARSASVSRATTATPTSRLRPDQSRRRRSATAAQAARSDGPIRRPGFPSDIAPTVSTATISAGRRGVALSSLAGVARLEQTQPRIDRELGEPKCKRW